MLLELKKIERDGVAIETDLVLDPLRGPGDLACPVRDVRFEGTAIPGERGVELRGRLRSRVEVACSRCLVPLDVPIAVDDLYLILVGDPSASDAAGSDDASGDAAVFVGCAGAIDLRDVITEQIYLQLPLKPVCREDCRGLCPTCGADRNAEACGCREREVDPRLAPLLQFRRPSGGA